MKKECLFIESASLPLPDGGILRGLSLELFDSGFFSVISEKASIKDALSDFFSGQGDGSAETLRINRRTVKKAEFFRTLRNLAVRIDTKRRLIPAFSIPENICMSPSMPKRGYKKRFPIIAQDLIRSFDLNLDIFQSVSLLTEKDRITVELLKAYIAGKKIFILNGISTLLAEKEAEEIRALLLSMQQRADGMCVLLLENPGHVAFHWADNILLLRGTSSFGTFSASYTDPEKVRGFYSQKNDLDRFAETDNYEESDQETHFAFSFENVSTPLLSLVSFRIGAGEILKIFGADDRSILGIRRCVTGIDRPDTGQILLNGRSVSLRGPEEMRKMRIAWCPKNAYETMLFPHLSVRENILLTLSVKTSSVVMRRGHVKSVEGMIEKAFGPGYAVLPVSMLTVEERVKLVYLILYLDAPYAAFIEDPFFNAASELSEYVPSYLRHLAGRGIAIILLVRSLEALTMVEGEPIYLMNGQAVSEDKLYQNLFR